MRAEHLRPRSRAAHTAALHCFVLDCSASMLAGARLARAKSVLAELLAQAYRWRDRIALIRFGGPGAAVHVPPRRAAALPQSWIAPIGGGGGTPLADALAQADALLHRHAQGPRWLWLLTDARTRATPARPAHAQRIVLIDFDDARPPLGRAAALADAWGPDVLCLPAAALCRWSV